MKKYFVAPIYYIPLKYASDLVNLCNIPSEQAAEVAIKKYAYYGKSNGKRLKEFDQNIFRHHLNRFLNTPNAIIVRKSPKYKSRKR